MERRPSGLRFIRGRHDQDGLLSAADAAMYAAKHTRKRLGQMLADESRLQAEHKTGK